MEKNDILLIQNMFQNKLLHKFFHQIRKKSALDLKNHNNPYQKTKSSHMRLTKLHFVEH